MKQKDERKEKRVTKKELEEKIKKLENEVKEKNELYLRALADYDNLRKRMENEINGKVKEGKTGLINDLITVVDSMEHGLKHMGEVKGCDEIKEGVEAIFSQMVNLLEKHGVKRLEVKRGDDFDPNHCEAIGFLEDNSLEENKIARVYQQGYMIDGKLLRPAKVLVSKKN